MTTAQAIKESPPLNAFCYPREKYCTGRAEKMDVLKGSGNAYDQYRHFLAKVTDAPIEEVDKYLNKEVFGTLGECKFGIDDPKVTIIAKNKYGDRVPKETTYRNVLAVVAKKDWILSPSMMAYCQPTEERSITAEVCTVNVARRSAFKKEMFLAKQIGDAILESQKNLDQANCKTTNNSLSGAHSSYYNILFMPSIHTALTSLCRTATSYANAHNERFISGNRHYHSAEIAINNMVTIAMSVYRDEKICEGITKLISEGLHVPTVKELLRMVHRGSEWYWRDDKKSRVIVAYLSKLDDLEKCAIMYMGDLFHLALYNRELVATLLDRLSTVMHVENLTLEQAKDSFSKMNGDLDTHISTMCSNFKHKEGWKKTAETDEDGYLNTASTIMGIFSTLKDYSTIISSFWMTDNLPASVHEFPYSIRRCVVGSDTDSTIFTVQDWVQWFTGKIEFNHKSLGIATAVTFLSSQINIHNLALVCGQMGIKPDKVHVYTMKSEFYFPITITSAIPKHYISSVAAQEGNVFESPDLDIKGVQFIKSKVKNEINTAFKQLVINIIDRLTSNDKMSILEVVNYVTELENTIRTYLLEGDATYLEYSRINTPDFYKQEPEKSKYFHYTIWNEAFGVKYGAAPPPPLAVYKVNVIGHSKTAFKETVKNFADKALSERLLNSVAGLGKDKLTCLYIPANIVEESGIPEELLCGGNFNKIVNTITSHFMLFLESLGLFINDKKAVRSFSGRYAE